MTIRNIKGMNEYARSYFKRNELGDQLLKETGKIAKQQ